MRQAPRSVLGIAAAVEAVTGLLLIVVPHLLAKLLLGVEVTGVAVVIGRVAGIALIALGVGGWLGRNEADGAGSALSAMLTYDLLVTAYLLVVGLGTSSSVRCYGLRWRRMPFLPRCSAASG
jgi:hypothetical protein